MKFLSNILSYYNAIVLLYYYVEYRKKSKVSMLVKLNNKLTGFVSLNKFKLCWNIQNIPTLYSHSLNLFLRKSSVLKPLSVGSYQDPLS